MQETGVLETIDGARREVCYFLNKITEKLEIIKGVEVRWQKVYKINMQALPFDIVGSKKAIKMKLTESKNITDPVFSDSIDDEIDDSLNSFLSINH